MTWLSIKYLKKLDHQKAWQSNQDQLSKYLCLIIEGLDNQAQEPNNLIKQYPKKAW